MSAVTKSLSACVYGIRSQSSDKYFYVGSTKCSAKTRFKAHLKQVAQGKHCNKHFQSKVRLLGAQNLTVDVLERVTVENRFEDECRWIKTLNEQGHDLTNIQLQPWPKTPEVPMTPNRLAYIIVEGAMMPEDCGIPQNQAIYSACRKVVRKFIGVMIRDHKPELMHFLATGELLHGEA